jgi:hypothetical protein
MKVLFLIIQIEGNSSSSINFTVYIGQIENVSDYPMKVADSTPGTSTLAVSQVV